MVKNEADVIESFVRHCLSFADQILIADHDSADATGEILAALQQEGLPLIVESVHIIEQAQAEVMTDLLGRAIGEYAADLVLPLDADEFLLSETAEISCRNILQQLDTRKVYGLPWVRYALEFPEQEQNEFLLTRSCAREREASSLQKILIGKEAAIQSRLIIRQGNHVAVIKKDNALMALLTEQVKNLHLAHFPERSSKQMMSKAATGWIGNVAKYSVNTTVANHWQKSFHKLCAGDILRPEPLTDAVPAVILHQSMTKLRYMDHNQIEPFRNLLLISEGLANAYAEEKILQREKLVSLLVLFLGDETEFKESLASAVSQQYPYKEILLYGMGIGSVDLLRNMVQDAATMSVVKAFSGLPNGLDIHGEYIQWVFPGTILVQHKIMKMLVSLETQRELTFVCSNTLQDSGSIEESTVWKNMTIDLPMKKENVASLLVANGTELWTYMLENGKPFSGGISSVLFRRALMEQVNWLQGMFMGNRRLFLSMWGAILQGSFVGVFRQNMVRQYCGCTPDDWLWQQLEWFCLLEEYKKRPQILSQHLYQRALRSFCQPENMAEDFPGMAGSDLYEQYRRVLQQAKSLGRL